MNKIHRDGVNFEIAFAAGTKRILSQYPQPVRSASFVDAEILPNAFNAQVECLTSEIKSKIGARQKIKKKLRSVVRWIYQLFKPILRPIGSRFRRYLITGLQQEGLLFKQDQQKDQAALWAAIQKEQNVLWAGMQSIKEFIVQEQGQAAINILQEVQASKALLRQEIRHHHARILQEQQQTSANTLQEIQTNNAVLKQEMHHCHALFFERLDRIETYSCASARRVVIPCQAGEVLIKTEVGYLFCSAEDYAVLACLIDTGDLERGTRQLIQRFLQPNDVFIDVGANLGLHTLAAGRAMNGYGKIIAFEPFEATKQLLEKSIWLNGFSALTQIYQVAVSSYAGDQALFLGLTSGHHSLFELDEASALAQQSVSVQTVRLDDVIPANQQVSLLKIDVEGAELDVLNGAQALMKNNPDIALIVEFGPSHLRRVGHSVEQWFSTFSCFGLTYRVINENTGRLEDYSQEQLQAVTSVNLFFAQPESTAWAKAKGDA